MECIQARYQLDRASFSLDVDLSLPARGITAIFGSSGSGKTTLLRCIAGLEHTHNGFLSINGEVWQDGKFWIPTYKRPLGYVFQEASLFPHLSVLGNLRYGLKRAINSKKGHLDQSIELLGIGHLLDRKPDRLSVGERDRISIARALAVNPKLLLMDEPLAALDFKRKQEILPYLERLHDELNIPVLFVSHSPDEIARLADHLVVLENGRVTAYGPLSELLARLDLPVKLGEEIGVVINATVNIIDQIWHLARVDFLGGSLWTRDRGIPVGRKVRVRIWARDVSLARQHPEQSSIQNVLLGRVLAIVDDEYQGVALVSVQIGEATVIAQLTKRAVAELDIIIGLELWVQVKSVALVESIGYAPFAYL